MRHIYALFISAAALILSWPAAANPNWWEPQEIPIEDQDAPTETEATNRIVAPPLMPGRATTSGYCCMSFDVTKAGYPRNITTTQCNARVFKKPSVSALKKWQFNPANVDGRSVYAKNQSRLMSFRLTDHMGAPISDKEGLMVVDGKFDYDIAKLCKGPAIS